jgi:hypothetical protein
MRSNDTFLPGNDSELIARWRQCLVLIYATILVGVLSAVLAALSLGTDRGETVRQGEHHVVSGACLRQPNVWTLRERTCMP